jgi:flavin reductase (DIM6/NTAB) family NADH-FMN oxidoreductase RutF
MVYKMSKVVWKGATLVAPLPPVMVTCGDMENANIITIAWTGILNSNPPKTYISVRPERYSYDILKNKRVFIINLPSSPLIKKTDYCGIYTGKKVNKFEKCGFTKEKASNVGCPLIAECPINIECRVTDIIPLGSHDMFIADIVAVNVDEHLIESDGKLHMEKAKLAAFMHGEYFELGRKIGHFGFSVKKKTGTKK